MGKLLNMELAPPFSHPPFGFRGKIARFVEDHSYSIGFGLQWKNALIGNSVFIGMSITEERTKKAFGNLVGFTQSISRRIRLSSQKSGFLFQ